MIRLKQMEETLAKEKLINSELKLSIDLVQVKFLRSYNKLLLISLIKFFFFFNFKIKNKELEESLKSNENRSLDTEISLEKLMDQLK